MNRRDALKRMAALTGGALSLSTAAGVLGGCRPAPDAEATVSANETGLFLGNDLGASIEITSVSSTDGPLRGDRVAFPSFNNAIDDSGTPAGFPITNVSQDGFWVVTAESLNVTYTVCLDYSGTTGIVDESELAVVKRDNASESWRPQMSVVDPGTQQVCATGLSAFSEFALGGSSANPLPVELAGLEAQLDGDAVHLTWQTASETNNAGFEVERSPDGGTRGDYRL
ncbi:MAG: hypothetical protein ABEK84_09240 [Salinibacter sp.]